VVIRAVNLVVEVFIDVADDGSAYAEALLLDSEERRLLARGAARHRPTDGQPEPADDRWLVAESLVNLADNLIKEAGAGVDGAAADRNRLRAA
jgi:hypothetical protein